MRNSKAKKLRKMIYGDKSIRGTKYRIHVVDGHITADGTRRLYRKAKQPGAIILLDEKGDPRVFFPKNVTKTKNDVKTAVNIVNRKIRSLRRQRKQLKEERCGISHKILLDFIEKRKEYYRTNKIA